MTRKNILMIFADQWRHDQFGAPDSQTPHLDALAREAVSFTRHYTQAIPCSPARASLFTGLYPQTHGVFANNVPLDARHRTLAQYLRQSEYAPTLFGYTDTRLDPRQFAEGDPRRTAKYEVLPGCDVGCHQPDDNPAEWMAHLRAQGLRFDTRDAAYAPDLSRPNATGGVAGHPARFAAADSDTAFLTDRLLDWHAEQQPGWCAMLCYLRPHNPTIAPAPWNGHVDPATLKPPTRHGSPEETAALHPYLAGQIAPGRCQPAVSAGADRPGCGCDRKRLELHPGHPPCADGRTRRPCRPCDPAAEGQRPMGGHFGTVLLRPRRDDVRPVHVQSGRMVRSMRPCAPDRPPAGARGPGT